MPEKVNGRLEVSAYGCHDLNSSEIWNLNERTDKVPKGRAIFTKKDVDDLDMLSFTRDPHPSFHGNIIGWPDGDEERDRLMEVAAALAEKSEFRAYPD